MQLNPEVALQIIVSVLRRTPINDAEGAGIQLAIEQLDKSIKELNEFKQPPKPAE